METCDLGRLFKWFCWSKGKKKLCKADLEGPAFNLVKDAFHKNIVFLQVRWMNAISCLTNKVDLYNPEGHQIQRNVYEPLPLGGPPAWIESYQQRSNVKRSKLDATDYYFKEDYMIVPKPRAVGAWRLDVSQVGWTREDSKKTSISAIDEETGHTDQKDLSKSRKLCWRKNKRY
ncbi:hypothetical protein Tco_0439373 [Tanacetum coccineum]